jgi:hypothetical protein
MKITRKKSLVVGIVAASLLGGSALAYWTTTGSGTGSAAVGNSSLVTVAQLPTAGYVAMTPGDSPQSINFSITNSAATNQTISSVVISIASVTGGTGTPVCTAADFTLVQPTAAYGDLSPGTHPYIGGGSGATLAMKNTALNQDACKTATVNLAFVAS